MISRFAVLGIMVATLQVPVCAGTSRSPAQMAMNKLLLEGNARAAWTLISRESAKPSSSASAYLSYVHYVRLLTLQKSLGFGWCPANHAVLAEESFGRALRSDQRYVRRSEVLGQYGTYLAAADRPGLAMPYLHEALSNETRADMRMSVLGTLSYIYTLMGQHRLASESFSQVMSIGKELIGAGRKRNGIFTNPNTAAARRKTAFMDQNEYERLLTGRMIDLAYISSADSRAEMKVIMKGLLGMDRMGYAEESRANFLVLPITAFAERGESNVARELLTMFRRLDERFPTSGETERLNRRVDILNCEASVLESEGEVMSAAKLRDEALTLKEYVLEKDPSLWERGVSGITHYKAGNYKRAIDLLEKNISVYERTRESFAVPDRTRFFEPKKIREYWALLNSYAARYEESRKRSDLSRVLRTIVRLQARQLGDVRAVSASQSVLESLEAATSQKKTAFLNYVLTSDHLVLIYAASGRVTLHSIPYGESELRHDISALHATIASPGELNALIPSLLKTSRRILGPAQAWLRGVDACVVVTDGVLAAIPFSLWSVEESSYRPLIEQCEVSLTPSMSFFIHKVPLRADDAMKRVLAIGDPVYTGRSGHGDCDEVLARSWQRTTREMGLFAPLPETRAEIAAIRRHLAPAEVVALMGSEASEIRLRDEDLTQFDYVHFATHAVLGNQLPGIAQPAIVLSQSSRGGDDGFLTLDEIEEFDMEADLVVLSACDTGRGEYLNAEGVLGLGRGFLAAGSRSVIVTLWSIPSHSTVALMTDFYTAMGSGMTTAGSLRTAQLKAMRLPHVEETRSASRRGLKIREKPKKPTGSLRHPRSWAAFMHIGL